MEKLCLSLLLQMYPGSDPALPPEVPWESVLLRPDFCTLVSWPCICLPASQLWLFFCILCGASHPICFWSRCFLWLSTALWSSSTHSPQLRILRRTRFHASLHLWGAIWSGYWLQGFTPLAWIIPVFQCLNGALDSLPLATKLVNVSLNNDSKSSNKGSGVSFRRRRFEAMSLLTRKWWHGFSLCHSKNHLLHIFYIPDTVRRYEVRQSWKRHSLCLQRIYTFFLSIWTWLSTKRIKVFWRP